MILTARFAGAATVLGIAVGLGLSLQKTRVDEPRKVPSSHFFDQRAYPRGEIDLVAYRQSRQEAFELRRALDSSRGAPVWSQRGPTNIQGRITAIAVDPLDQDVAFAAAAEGGVFRTLDAGNTWTPLFDDQSSLSMGDVAIDPSNPLVVYAGTGEANPGGGSVAYGGTGLYRSTDRGDTWSLVGLENSGSIARVVVHPTNSDILHVAVLGHLWSAGDDRGIYRTTDGGATWTKVLFVDDTTGGVDLLQRPDDPDVLFAAMWQRLRMPGSFDYGGVGCGVYTSTDGGATWSLVGGGLPAPSTNGGRIGLALHEADPDVMCAIYADRSGDFDGIYRTLDGGVSWSSIPTGPLGSALYSTYGWWFGQVRIHPDDPDEIYALGIPIYRTTNAGSSWQSVTGGMHVDMHALAFGAGSPRRIYCGNDGGVYTSTNGTSWTKTSGDFPITQAYRIAVAPWDSDALWIGAQDNGTSADIDGDGSFAAIYGGDGFEIRPHLTSSSRIWAQFQGGQVAYSSNGGGSFTSATSGLVGRRNWNAPHEQDPSDPETRYFGTDRVHRNSGNTAWSAISGDLTGGPGSEVFGTLTSLGVSPVDGDVVWAGSDDGFVHVTTNGGASWTDVSSTLPERWVTSITAHPGTASTALVTLSGFRWDESEAQVFRTDDFGGTWTPIGAGLPDAPANDTAIDPMAPTHYYVATDVGVFVSLDAGATWAAFGAGLPNVVVNELELRPESRELFAGTYGRSIFSADLAPVVSVPDRADEPTVVLPAMPNPTSGVTRFAWSDPGVEMVTVRVFSVSGRLVWQTDAPGSRGAVAWDGRGLDGKLAANGVYLVEVLADGVSLDTQRLVVRR